MLTLPPSTRVFVATKPADMRRSFDGLLALVRDFLGHEDPLSGHLFVFRNKSGDRLKVIWWDIDGPRSTPRQSLVPCVDRATGRSRQ